MTNSEINPLFQKNKYQKTLEYCLFILCLCVIAIRVVFTEGLNIQVTGRSCAVSIGTYSLSISAVLIFSFIIWFVWNLLAGDRTYRFTAIETGLVLFCIAAVAAGFAASNKRAAITDFITLLGPMLMAVLLVQLLDTRSKVNILLLLITVMGTIAALYCLCQLLWLNPAIIEQYESDPDFILDKLAIEAGTFEHMLFEHSLYSRDIRGFFVTGNSAGSFALLAFFAALALFLKDLKDIKFTLNNHPGVFAVSAILTVICLFGLLVTKSKGAVAAAVIASVILACCICFGGWLKNHKRTVLSVCLFAAAIIATAIVSYGLKHDRLPGGSSMLVRWQYWSGAVRMYADHPFTGVGGGNFANFYPAYKTLAALETVADPHNFPLSILTQYGPLGLVGFLAAVLIPMGLIVFSVPSKPDLENNPSRLDNIIIKVLCCAILGFLLHNCIDFAIFEPGILTTFWAITACFVALDHQKNHRIAFVLKPTLPGKIITVAAALIIIPAYFNYALVPVAKAHPKTRRAARDLTNAYKLLAQAAAGDRLDPAPLSLKGRVYLHQYHQTKPKSPALLNKAAECFKKAILRNRADYKNYDRLSGTYNLLAESANQNAKKDWLNKAFDSALGAVERYPGSAQLRIKLAVVAERLGRIDITIENYEKAVEIEDAYRKQFQIMYPGQKIFSRLGEQNYNLAKEQLKKLSPKQIP